MKDNTVINLASGESVTVIKRADTWCHGRCRNVVVDAHARQLACRECGATVDAFDWAMGMARDESTLLRQIEHLKSELAIHGQRLAELQDEEKRVKARIRSAKDSLIKAAGV